VVVSTGAEKNPTNIYHGGKKGKVGERKINNNGEERDP